MLEVCIHQIKDNLKNLKFLISFVIILLLMILNGVVFSFRYENKNNEYRAIIASRNDKTERIAQNLNWVAFAQQPVIKKSLTSEFIVEGKQNKFPDTINLNVEQISLPERVFFYNKRLILLPPIDWVFIVSIIISFLIFILTYDSISGEKEKGTLRLVFANSLSKIEFILGKLFGISLSIMLPLIVGTIVNFILIVILGKITLTSLLIFKAMLFLFYALFFVFFFVSIGLFVSLTTHSSLKSLILLSLIWIVMVIITPITGKIVIEYIYNVPKNTEVNENYKRVEQNLGDLYAKYQAGDRGYQYGKADNYKLERNKAKVFNELAWQKQKILDNYLTKKLNQAKYFYLFINISPVYLFQHCIENLFNTGLNRDIRINQHAKILQQQLIDFVKQVDYKDNASPHIYFLQNYLSSKSVAAASIPKFREPSINVFRSTIDSAGYFILLLIELILITIIICFRFQRMIFV